MNVTGATACTAASEPACVKPVRSGTARSSSFGSQPGRPAAANPARCESVGIPVSGVLTPPRVRAQPNTTPSSSRAAGRRTARGENRQTPTTLRPCSSVSGRQQESKRRFLASQCRRRRLVTVSPARPSSAIAPGAGTEFQPTRTDGASGLSLMTVSTSHPILKLLPRVLVL